MGGLEVFFKGRSIRCSEYQMLYNACFIIAYFAMSDYFSLPCYVSSIYLSVYLGIRYSVLIFSIPCALGLLGFSYQLDVVCTEVLPWCCSTYSAPDCPDHSLFLFVQLTPPISTSGVKSARGLHHQLYKSKAACRRTSPHPAIRN
ncbi:hypothetical protein F4778DRAFT_141660 [Xylariomycetidae sp. FL2044]|nr:hypothetical protein F4778DRAFT_141660 [Xylariomycetidae sp. FL2044]